MEYLVICIGRQYGSKKCTNFIMSAGSMTEGGAAHE